MNNPEIDAIVRAAKRKHLPAGSTILFNCGKIALCSLIAGLAFFQLTGEVPQEFSPAEAARFRLALGAMLGGILSICGFTIYAIVLRIRGLRMQRERDIILNVPKPGGGVE